MHFIRARDYLYIVQQQELNMNVFAKLKKYAADRRAVRELGALDDRALQDLGISRSHIRPAPANRSE
jgi:uncharacterized protein YjiS (DUF1127 family)